MLKFMFAVLAFALAGTASAAGWRNLRIDASSEAAFNESVAAFQKKLSPSRRLAFTRSLHDIQLDGTQRATAEQRDYTRADYLQQLHGLGYEEVVTLTEPTGQRAAAYRREYYYARQWGGGVGQSGNPQSINPLWIDNTIYSTDRIPYRGWTDLTGSGQR
jgi:hypothetical protein